MSDSKWLPSEADLLAIMENRLRELQAQAEHQWYADWSKLMNEDDEIEWLVEDVWPMGRQLHMHAARKTGKSLLTLWIAANIATGRDPFTGREREPVRVAYLDHEMTPADVRERITDMGFADYQLHGWLFYGFHPVMPPLDTQAGGLDLMRKVEGVQAKVVIIDTFSRVVQGEENSNDTAINFYRFTGSLLKAAGVAMLRLDHEGHTSEHSRGGSAKADDVDVVWRLTRTDDGVKLIRKASRISWVPEIVNLRQTEPLGYERCGGSVPEGTLEKVRELDALGAPIDVSKRQMIAWLKERDIAPGRSTILMAAITYRKNRIFGV